VNACITTRLRLECVHIFIYKNEPPMYSGITAGMFEITSLVKQPDLIDYTVCLSAALCEQLRPGNSVSVNGVCQTLVRLEGSMASFQAMRETLERTTLGELERGSWVSIERSLCWGDEMGGHEVSGHVFGTATIYEKRINQNIFDLIVQCDPLWMKYILPKGFIAVDGSSLTVGDTEPTQGLFHLHLIPETLKLTGFSNKNVGDKVNIEFDHKTKTIVDTVERLLSCRSDIL